MPAMKRTTYVVALLAWLTLGGVLIGNEVTTAQAPITQKETTYVHMYGRDDCGFCKAQVEFFTAEGIAYEYHNIVTDDTAAAEFSALADKHDVSRVTPLTVIGDRLVVGFDGPRTTGEQIKEAIERAQTGDIITPEDHLERAEAGNVILGGGCSGAGCDAGEDGVAYIFDLPFVGLVDLKSFSLFGLSAVLGVIDGFNPCAMWVLITFIVLLSQAGSRKKMIFLAGLFVIAQGVMYNLILNVWYKTWDFVALDQYVTPLVGFIALGGGLFFVWRWYKNRETQLVCDISDIETQAKTINKFKAIAQQPITIASVLAILAIAFSVNIIEFACSIGIPQAYTKILELNALTFLERQWYILIFTLGYMLDDVIVFALAIWGYDQLQAHGHKYAQWSLLIGGLLMLALGALLVFAPSALVL